MNTGPQAIARIAKECGVERLIHVSSLNANEDPEPLMLKEGSGYLSAKARGNASPYIAFIFSEGASSSQLTEILKYELIDAR